ncbi:early nodulin-like protein 2 [Impatiens glandulifera]|uniref:early nodulin-like protein 2 n=1 Tax=Impatiens glandulifera TaxID=253017 RepID=UPI001FB17D38|nr:early nodulin-like protein 2 [Impatiens glandulifera]
MVKKMILISLMVVICLSVGETKVVAGHTNHVVGADRGWDPATKLSGWSSGRTFRVGDKIWFAYSVVSESMVELGSKEEYELCDLSNPIRMYTDGLNSVSLEEEGARYFVSGKTESCKNGLKLHVVVEPEQSQKQEEGVEIATSESSAIMAAAAAADGPTPSASTHFRAAHTVVMVVVVSILLLVCSAF